MRHTERTSTEHRNPQLKKKKKRSFVLKFFFSRQKSPGGRNRQNLKHARHLNLTITWYLSHSQLQHRAKSASSVKTKSKSKRVRHVTLWEVHPRFCASLFYPLLASPCTLYSQAPSPFTCKPLCYPLLGEVFTIKWFIKNETKKKSWMLRIVKIVFLCGFALWVFVFACSWIGVL